MAVTPIREYTHVADMNGPLLYWGPVAAAGTQWPSVPSGLTPLAAVREALRSRPARAA